MNLIRQSAGIAIIFAVLTLGACNGSDGALSAKKSSVPATTTAKGIISSFDSLHVNGIQYTTENITVSMDGNPATLNDLHVGMVVTVKGTMNLDRTAGIAKSVEFSSLFKGPVTVLDPSASTIVIFGQTVKVNKETFCVNFHGLADLKPGDILEVSGFNEGNGLIRATYLNKKNSLEKSVIKGNVVAIVDGTTLSVQLTTGAPPLKVVSNSLINPLIKVGTSMEVAVDPYGSGGNTVIATGIRRYDPLPIADGEVVVLEGYITEFNSLKSLQVNGIGISADGLAATKDLTLTRKVLVSGIMKNGLLQATSLEKELESDVVLSGVVDSVASGTLVLNIQGCRVFVNERTAFRDDSNSRVRSFGLGGASGAKKGDYLEISGQLGGDSIIATKVVRKRSP